MLLITTNKLLGKFTSIIIQPMYTPIVGYCFIKIVQRWATFEGQRSSTDGGNSSW